METNSKALEKFIEENSNLAHKVRGLPDLGGSALGGDFTGEVKRHMMRSLFMVMSYIVWKTIDLKKWRQDL